MIEFSVVIGVFNKEDYVANTLQSVLDQTFGNFEVIVVNDGSTDSSEEIIKSFDDPRINYFKQENKGAGAARNAAIAKATKPWIALLDADDIWHPDYLEVQHQLIQDYPDHKVFATNSIMLRNSKKIPRKYSIEFGASKDVVVNYFKASYLDSVLHSSTTVINIDVLDKVGNYNASIRSGQDTDLYIRIGLNYEVVFSTKVCAVYNVNKSSLFESAKKISDKPGFSSYEAYEKDNPSLKKFLDLNRYSLCLIAKMDRDKEAFDELFQKIDLSNLSRRQRTILKLNGPMIKFAKRIQRGLEASGIQLGSFE